MRILLILISLLCLTSCSRFYNSQNVIQNRETDYLKAQSIPPLKIPPGLSSSSIEPHYPASTRTYPNNYIPVDLTPPELYTSGR
jgi:uncharacterized lipoprotein